MDIVSYLLGKNSAGGGGGGGKYKPQFIKFQGFTGTDLLYETQNLDTSLITNMSNMFNGCSSLKEVDFSGWDVSNVTTFQRMLINCYGFNNKLVFGYGTFNQNTSFDNTFSTMSNLKELDLSGLHSGTGDINMSYAFSYCYALTKLDIRNLDTSKFTNYINMFFQTPVSCLIIVGTAADKSWFATNFPSYTNVKTPSEL